MTDGQNLPGPDGGPPPSGTAEILGIDPTHYERAKRLADFARDTGAQIERRIVETLYWAGQALAGADIEKWQAQNQDQRIGIAFQLAYRNLAATLSQVTAETLIDTCDEEGRRFYTSDKISEARIWSRKLWIITLSVVLLVLFVENFDAFLLGFYPLDSVEDDSIPWSYASRMILLNILPFAYGALGACTYLLRACHGFIGGRTFDRARIPEYFSRMILGLIAGGSILFFAETIIEDGQTINLESKALAFLAGYNIDFLFSAMDRVVQAVLPKIGIEGIRRRRPADTTTVSVEELTRQMAQAEDPAVREFLQDLIRRVTPEK